MIAKNTPATLKLEDLAIEPLSELCKEAYEETAWALESTLKKAIHFGRLLCIAKAKIPHGGWSTWVAATFEDQISLRNIQRFMQVAESNTTEPSLLEGAKNLDDALVRIQVKKIPAAAEVIEPNIDVIEAGATDDDGEPDVEPDVIITPAKKSSKPVVSKPQSNRDRDKITRQIVRAWRGKDDDAHNAVFRGVKLTLQYLERYPKRGRPLLLQAIETLPDDQFLMVARAAGIIRDEAIGDK